MTVKDFETFFCVFGTLYTEGLKGGMKSPYADSVNPTERMVNDE